MKVLGMVLGPMNEDEVRWHVDDWLCVGEWMTVPRMASVAGTVESCNVSERVACDK